MLYIPTISFGPIERHTADPNLQILSFIVHHAVKEGNPFTDNLLVVTSKRCGHVGQIAKSHTAANMSELNETNMSQSPSAPPFPISTVLQYLLPTSKPANATIFSQYQYLEAKKLPNPASSQITTYSNLPRTMSPIPDMVSDAVSVVSPNTSISCWHIEIY